MAEPIIPSDAVQAIKDSVETKTIEVGGRAFVTRPEFKTPAKETANGSRVATRQGSDGFSQTVTVKAGITRVEKAIVPNPVTLIPFRTFREVEQPSSSFILRLTGGEKPKAALFEADGGQWKLEAIKNIKAFFDGKDLNIPIIC